MKRIVIEVPLGDFEQYETKGSVLWKIETAEVLRLLRHNRDEVVMILRIRFKEPLKDPGRVGKELGIDAQLLDAKDGAYIFLGKCRPVPGYPDLGFFGKTGYFVPPIEVREGSFRFTFIGPAQEGRRLIEGLGRAHIRHRVVSASDARFDPESPLNSLTERQCRVLRTAYRMGYYDRPRRVSSSELARRLGVATSTLVNHRLKGERRLLRAVMGDR